MSVRRLENIPGFHIDRLAAAAGVGQRVRAALAAAGERS